MEKISYIIPCYCSVKTLESVVQEIRTVMATLPQYIYEIILIDDASPDGTYGTICELASRFPECRGICLARNFGQHGALMAGFRACTGDIVICLDDDGQTPADEVGKLLAGIEQGADVVYAQYEHKKHSIFRNMGSRLNDWMACYLLGKPRDLYLSSYFAARRFVIEEVKQYEHSYPYVIGLVLRATNRIVNVKVSHREREIGTSGYTLRKLIMLWCNGFTAFSIKPLRMATIAGGMCAFAGFAYGIYTVIKKFVNPDVPLGFSSTMAALMFIGGMIMLMLGLIGEYIGRIYMSMNRAPQYVIRETIDTTIEIKDTCEHG